MATDPNQFLIEYYQRSQKRLREIILNPPGRTDSSREFRMARASSLFGQVDDVLKGLNAQAVKWAGSAIPANYRTGRQQADRQIAEWGIGNKGEPAGSLSLVDRRSIDVLARDSAGDLVKAAGAMADKTKRLLREMADKKISTEQVNQIIATGVIEGTPRAAIRELRDELIAVHEGRLVTITDRNGDPMTFDAAKYAETVVRTKTREAVETARHERLLTKNIGLVSITGRVSQYFCTAFLGMVCSIDGSDKEYPALASLPGGGPPFHPLCSKSTRAYIPDLASDEQRAAARGIPDARKLVGMDQAEAQRSFKDLQLLAQVKPVYRKLTPIKERS